MIRSERNFPANTGSGWKLAGGLCEQAVTASATRIGAASRVISSSTRVHFAVWVVPQTIDLVERPPVGGREPLLRSTIRPDAPRFADQVRQPGVRRAAPERLSQVGAALAIETPEPHSVGRDAAP